MLPLPLFGIPDGYDTPQHLRFVETYQNAISTGTIIPSWASVDNFGFGSIGIRFYPPLAHYLMAFVQSIVHDWFDTIWITCYFWMILGSIGIYFWAKEYLEAPASAIAAILFATMPYHLTELYVYVLLAEFAAISVLPFCFLFATRVIRYGRPLDVLLFALAYSTLILTHLPSIIIGSIGLGIYCLCIIDWANFWKPVLNFAVAFGITLSATAFYLVRLVTEVNWVKHNESQFFATDIYNYRQYLFPMILNPDPRFWKKMVLLVDIPTFLTFLFLLPPVFALIFKAVKKKDDPAKQKLFAGLSVLGLFLIFLLSMPSAFVWDHVSILQKVQFPFRFLSLACVIASIGVATAIPALQTRFPSLKKAIGYAVFGLLFATALFTLTQVILPSDPFPREKFREKIESMQKEPGCRCWWPTWADSRAFNDSHRAAASDRAVIIKNWDEGTRSVSVAPGEATNLRIATFWYPYWRASINGRAADSLPDEFGAISIPLGPERSEVSVRFQEPAFVGAAKYFSLAAWVLLFASLVAVLMFRKQNVVGLIADRPAARLSEI
ncbi:MAG: 6-pyruvoyl-tetrahydropterin synthase-related protein [Acidobacteriota bacterium]